MSAREGARVLPGSGIAVCPRQGRLDRALDAEVTDPSEAIQARAVARYLEQRAAAHDALRGHGVMVLDVTTAQLPAALVERYLAVKREGLL